MPPQSSNKEFMLRGIRPSHSLTELDTSAKKSIQKQPHWLVTQAVSWMLFAVVVFCWVAVFTLTPSLNDTAKRAGAVPDYIATAVPLFFVQIFIEMIVAFTIPNTWNDYNLADGIASMSAGATQGLIELIVHRPLMILSGPYMWIWATAGFHDFAETIDWTSWSVRFAVLLAVDFCYYWLHRMGHELAFFWAAHAVHHSSEHYNLTTALRQSPFQSLFGPVFYWPLAFFIPPNVFLLHSQVNTLFQFWVHLKGIDSLGPIEWFFMTPKHHRVHHDRRVHKNYAGMFIIWDRLFGTFADEGPSLALAGTENVIYGITAPVNSYNPYTIQMQVWNQLFSRISRTSGIFSKISAWMRGPGYRPAMLYNTKLQPVGPTVKRIRYRNEASWPAAACMTVAFGLSVLETYLLLQFTDELSMVWRISGCVTVIVGLTTIGHVLSAGKNARLYETFRHFITCAILQVCIHQGPNFMTDNANDFFHLLTKAHALLGIMVATFSSVTSVQVCEGKRDQ